MPLHIDEVYCFIGEDDEGEGITGFHTKSGWMPMVGADKERVDSLRPMAEELARATGKRIVLTRFTTRTELEVIDPNVGRESRDLAGR